MVDGDDPGDNVEMFHQSEYVCGVMVGVTRLMIAGLARCGVLQDCDREDESAIERAIEECVHRTIYQHEGMCDG